MPNSNVRRWAKRKHGSVSQVGKPFPIFGSPAVQTAGRGFQEQLRTAARPAKTSVFKTKNPLTDATSPLEQDERPPQSLVDQIRSATTEKSEEEEEEELKAQVAEKILQYMKTHPESTLEEAETEVTGTPTEHRQKTTQKIKKGISRIMSTLGFGKGPEEEEGETSYVYDSVAEE